MPLKREAGRPYHLAARCRIAAQAEAVLAEKPSLLIVPLSLPEEELHHLVKAGPVAVELPRGLFGREEELRRRLETAFRAGIRAALCGNIGALPLVREAGMTPLGGFGLNVTNRETAEGYASRGLGALTLSPELSFRQIQRLSLPLSLPAGLLIYGCQPLMLTRNCPVQAAAQRAGEAAPCPSCKGNGRLIDRKGVAFPVMCEDGPGSCAELLNSRPLYWGRPAGRASGRRTFCCFISPQKLRKRPLPCSAATGKDLLRRTASPAACTAGACCKYRGAFLRFPGERSP